MKCRCRPCRQIWMKIWNLTTYSSGRRNSRGVSPPPPRRPRPPHINPEADVPPPPPGPRPEPPAGPEPEEAMEYNDLLDRDFEGGFSSSSSEEERPSPPPTRATPAPARATATGRRTYAQACTVATVARCELDRLSRGSGLDSGDVDGLRGRGRGNRGGAPPQEQWRG